MASFITIDVRKSNPTQNNMFWGAVEGWGSLEYHG
jgi:hypothetical protein